MIIKPWKTLDTTYLHPNIRLDTCELPNGQIITPHLLEYDDVLNQQRIVIYNHRLDALEGENRIYELVRDFIVTIVQELVAYNAPTRHLKPEQVAKVYEGGQVAMVLKPMAMKDSDIPKFFPTYKIVV